MSNADRLIVALGPLFADGSELEIDAPLIDAWIDALIPLSAQRFTALMSSQTGIDQEFGDAEGLREGWKDWLAAFSEVKFEIEAVEEIGANVITVASQVATTRHGVELEQPSAAVWKFNDQGRLYRVEFHLDREAALESARAA
jgi:hypothetical protein